MFYIGADPECFVGNSSGVKSIIGRVGGTKEHPQQLPLGEGFAVQEDNVALEFNIPASPTRKLFVENIVSARDFLANLMDEYHGLQLVKESAAFFPAEELQDPAALVFGCDPDFNAYTGRKNPRPRATDASLRSCGGHVHIGIKGTEYAALDERSIIQAMDLYTGIPSVLMDKGDLRKQLYGKAGAYRIKSYGVEYRTISNWWIFEERLIDWVYLNTERALNAVLYKMSFAEDAKLIQATIDNNNRDSALALVEKYKLEVI
jgi:hypothetical protein